MTRQAIDPANIRRAATRHRRQVARWWLERVAAALIIMTVFFAIGTLQANFEGHTPSAVEGTTP